MATTRIISMHVNQGKTIADCLTDRIDYSKNPDKTQGGELISAYECDPKTADAEFLFAKRQYKTLTGREQQSDVIAYQVRQSFKPGEITPEDANRVGYEFAERFLKGRHAFFVATHTDKKHIHNHIIWNSTTLDYKRKFRDFLGSGRAVARLSDAICTEHRLSVIAAPKRGKNHYGKWLGNKAKPSHRELLCGLIDAALLQKPDGFDALLKLLRDSGCEVRRRGNTLSLRHPDKKGFVRLSSIDGYTEDELRAVLAGEKEHTPRKKRGQTAQRKNTLLIDIEAKLQAGKGVGYERWAKVFNVKQMAQTYNYLREHGLLDYGELEEKASAATEQFHALSAQIKAAETRMAEIAVLLKKLLNIDAGTGLAFKQNQREGCNFFHRMHMVKITVIIRRSNEKLMCIEAVPDGIRVLILRFAGKRNINLTGVQIVEHHLACAIQDSDLDSRIILVERLKARNQIGLRDRIACADDEFTREQLARLRKLFFAALDEAQTVRNPSTSQQE